MENKKEVSSLERDVEIFKTKFLKKTEGKEIKIISHFDTDGISSAVLMMKTLKELDKKFSLEIVKNLEEKFIKELAESSEDQIILFLDLASGSLEHIKKHNLKEIFIIDHHEMNPGDKLPEDATIISPEFSKKEKISASGLTYIFCKSIYPEAKEFAKLGVLGMIGDRLDKETCKINYDILKDGEIKKKKGLLIYPSTRPLNRALEYSSNPFIPGVTGNPQGVKDLLREAGIPKTKKGYKSLLELDEEEMSKLVTGVMLRNPKAQHNEIIGYIYLLKFFNRQEDARELSAIINACSRLDKPCTAIRFCMEIPSAKKEAESIYAQYKQHIISGLKYISEIEKIENKGFIIINAQDKVKDTIVGTLASILSSSSIYEEGTTIIAMAHNEDGKIKISARNVKSQGRNLREIMSSVSSKFGGEHGGHQAAAGALINKEHEKDFIEYLKKHLEIERVKI